MASPEEEDDGLYLKSDSISWPQGRAKTEEIGHGSYGAVYPVKVYGLPCIAKRLHDVLSEAAHSEARALADGEMSITDRFMQECEVLSTLHHPNIVQFMGIYRSNQQQDVYLIMEGLFTDLDQFLATNRDIPLELKLSFLLDTSNALVYLHKRKPVIIHRDVKAANVLLGRDMRAKLADLGTSKLLKFNPLGSMKYSKCPGTLGIMPPEALQNDPEYDTKLDVFSFGTLILHVINQDFPMSCEVSQPRKKGELQLTKRQAAIDKLIRHPLLKITQRCLLDSPDKRPTMENVRDSVEKLSLEHPCNFTDFYDMRNQIGRLHQELRGAEELSARIAQLEEGNGKLKKELKDVRVEHQLAEAQAAIFKEDFERERGDRERAAGEYDSEKMRLAAEKEALCKELQLEKASRIRLQNELMQRQRTQESKKMGSKYFTTRSTRRMKAPAAVGDVPSSPVEDDLLQSLRFVPTEHSSGGGRCSQRYEWYQTASYVTMDIMIPNVKDDDILVEFSEKKVKVFIDTGGSPYRLSLHTCHKIIPPMCIMKCLKTKVELRMRKADGAHWSTLDERGEPPKTSDKYFQKWDSLSEDTNGD